MRTALVLSGLSMEAISTGNVNMMLISLGQFRKKQQQIFSAVWSIYENFQSKIASDLISEKVKHYTLYFPGKGGEGEILG